MGRWIQGAESRGDEAQASRIRARLERARQEHDKLFNELRGADEATIEAMLEDNPDSQQLLLALATKHVETGRPEAAVGLLERTPVAKMTGEMRFLLAQCCYLIQFGERGDRILYDLLEARYAPLHRKARRVSVDLRKAKTQIRSKIAHDGQPAELEAHLASLPEPQRPGYLERWLQHAAMAADPALRRSSEEILSDRLVFDATLTLTRAKIRRAERKQGEERTAQYQEAQRIIAMIRSLAEWNERYHLYSGMIEHRLGHAGRGDAHFEKVLALPDLAAHWEVAHLLEVLGHQDRALALRKRLESSTPTDS